MSELSSRPRRSTRAPVRTPEVTVTRANQPKRKSENACLIRLSISKLLITIHQGDEDEDVAGLSNTRKKQKLDQLQILLCDPKSALTTMDISVCVSMHIEPVLSIDVSSRCRHYCGFLWSTEPIFV